MFARKVKTFLVVKIKTRVFRPSNSAVDSSARIIGTPGLIRGRFTLVKVGAKRRARAQVPSELGKQECLVVKGGLAAKILRSPPPRNTRTQLQRRQESKAWTAKS